MDYDEIIDHLISEKIDYKDYKEISEEIEDEELKEMFTKIANDEHNHYKMIKEYLSQMIKD